MTSFIRRSNAALILILAAAVAAPAALAATTPKQLVQRTIGETVLVLQDATLDREQKWEKIADTVRGVFDFRSMSQSILASNWQSATPEEKEDFIAYFSEYLEEFYRTKIETYTNQRIETIGETVAGDRASVDTVIVTDSARIPVTYKLKNNDGEWFVYDVVVEGVGLVNNYRQTYAPIVKNDGMEGLLSEIKANIDSYRADALVKQAE